jgi:1,5-anhydro-D-fructose reductase (1,5-anhydro-D-mannitol-forming)
MIYKSIKWGMIGVGDVTQRKSAPSFNKITQSSLVAVGSRTPENARRYAVENGIRKCYDDPLQVIDDPEVDAVYVATPPDSHTEYALKVIEAGKPVYIEKPMARTYQECRQINEAAALSNVPVFVAYYRRSLEYFQRVKKILAREALGKVLALHIDQHFKARPEDFNRESPPWRVVPEISGGGYFHDVGCHALDILFYLFGDPLSVTGNASNLSGIYEPEDTVTALIQLSGDLLLSGNWSFVVPEVYQRDRVCVTGENGTLSFSIFSFEPIRLDIQGDVSTISVEQQEHIQMPFIQTIVNELTGKGVCPSTGITAAVTSRAMDEILGCKF